MKTSDRPGRVLGISLLMTVFLASAPVSAMGSKLNLEVEAGAAWQSYNDVQIPNDATGTRFSLTDLVGKGPWAAGRLYATWNPGDRHGLRVLYAPLSINETGNLSGPLNFNGHSFAAGPATATYTFNSYRLTYRYLMKEGVRGAWWLGFTAKMRDAQIAIEQGPLRSAKDDLGFVPLLHLAAQWWLPAGWRLDFDADALAGGPGRAEDVALKLSRSLGDRVRLSAGYRLVEGGADVDEVYTFAWLHYAVTSLLVAF